MIKVLFEDKDIIVVNKPSNMPSQRDFSRTFDMESAVLEHVGTKPFVIHRLDRHVEGPVVLAKSKKAAKKLNEQLIESGFIKRYKAVVLIEDTNKLVLNNKEYLIHYLSKEKSVAKVITVDEYRKLNVENQKRFKKAKLNYVCIKEMTYGTLKIALLDIELITGRFHQIRSQMKAVGLKILGDPKYGIKQLGDISFDSISLQCVLLGFIHPITNKNIKFISEHHREGFKLFE